jgi:preprotein translocase subunit SecE
MLGSLIVLGSFALVIALIAALVWPKKDNFKSKFVSVLSVSLIATLILIIFSVFIFGHVKSIDGAV